MANQQAEIYDAYVQRWHETHPNVVKPVVGYRSELAPSIDWTDCISDQGRTRFFDDGIYFTTLADGRVVESSRDSMTLAIFPSEEARLAFNRPMPMWTYLYG